jgi:hypothetical protein
MDQTNVLVTIMETFMKSHNSDKARGKDYSTHFYPTHYGEKLHMLIGMPRPWHGLGEEAFPNWFKEFKLFQSSTLRARDSLKSNCKTSSQDCTWSSELMQALLEMIFVAGDVCANGLIAQRASLSSAWLPPTTLEMGWRIAQKC